MKRAGILAAAVLLFVTSVPSFAQQTDTTYPKDVYYKVVPLMKVWSHQLGYVVQFFNSKSKVVDVYVPLTWFNKGINSKADIVYGNEPGYPYMSIFWADGKFDHVTLYVESDAHSSTWGVLTPAQDLTNQFNVQEVPRDF